MASSFAENRTKMRKRRALLHAARMEVVFKAFSGEVDTGSREENARQNMTREPRF
jgi:hypothetical protein